jgi:hypothetical protein
MLIRQCEGPAGTLPAGSVIDHADAHRLVALGYARPYDEEAARRAHVDRLEAERVEQLRLEAETAIEEERQRQ